MYTIKYATFRYAINVEDEFYPKVSYDTITLLMYEFELASSGF